MKPEEFISFNEKPGKNRWIVVTNNINARDANGEMSHVWLTKFWTESTENENFGIVTFDDADRRIINLTHWKYV